MFNEETYRTLLGVWDLEFARMRPELEVAGSPERSIFRVVVEDRAGRLFVLERISDPTLDRKRLINLALRDLRASGLSRVHPYLRGKGGELLARHGDGHWQLMPYLHGVPLERPGYIADAWRGEHLAGFLAALRERSQGLPHPSLRKPFSILAFIDDLHERIAAAQPGLLASVRPIERFLGRSFRDVHDTLPVALCHGDYHPLNVIWSERGIVSVIDWEFLGYKPEVYDAANLIGCVGFERPDALAGNLVRAFLGALRVHGFLSERSLSVLPEFVLALRFGWLSDWLRKRDAEMVDLELAYMGVLLRNADALRRAWA